jgi:hypothetical protein
LRGSESGHKIDILLRKICAPVERAFIPENLRALYFRHDSYFISRMNVGRLRNVGKRRETQAQPASQGMQGLFEFHTGKLDFVSITPWQTCRLIAQVAVPSQRRFQWEASLLKERDHVIRIPRLFRNASSQESK